MIERTVYVKLNGEHATPEGRAAVAAHSHEVLSGLPGVLSVRVALPADSASARSWDLSAILQLESLEALEAYRVDPTHRAYVDTYLAPRVACIKAWNWEIYEP